MQRASVSSRQAGGAFILHGGKASSAEPPLLMSRWPSPAEPSLVAVLALAAGSTPGPFVPGSLVAFAGAAEPPLSLAFAGGPLGGAPFAVASLAAAVAGRAGAAAAGAALLGAAAAAAAAALTSRGTTAVALLLPLEETAVGVSSSTAVGAVELLRLAP